MTVIDPALDRGPGATVVARPDGRELAMLRHDIRGALQGVVGGVVQLERAALDEATREQVERIAAAAQTLGALVAIALGEEVEADREAPVVDVARLLRRVRRRYAGEARARGLGLEVGAASDVPAALRLDLVSVCRILDNLVGNAIKFADAGAVRLEVMREADGAILFRISDDGPGLPAAPLDAAPPAGPARSGLGLHVVRAIAARLGGDLRLANRSGGGLEAAVRFPPEVAGQPGRPAAATLPDFAGLRILLAEDNPTNQMVASQMLRSLNARVTVCGDGVEALEQFEAGPVDLVVVDIEMPRLSGLDVIRRIRARDDARAQVPIVALTAYAMREHRERIAAAGANGLISKPITSVEALGRGLALHVAPLLAPEAARPVVPAAPAAGADSGEPVIDLATFDALCQAIGPDTMDELLDKVIADLASAQCALEGALEPFDPGPIRSASHILISVAGALGAVRLEACARKLNAAAHAQEPEQVAPGVRQCIAEIDAALAFARDRRAAR